MQGTPPTRPSGPENALFQTSAHDACDDAACAELLGVETPDAVDVLVVTFTRSTGERLSHWKRHADAPPANLGLVSVDVGGSNGGDRARSGGPSVRHVSDPSDLTGVGIAIAEFLSAWADSGNRTVVCVDSVTALLQYVETNRAFQFLNEITSKLEGAGASAHFHITPAAHDEQVLSVLSSLFDDRVTAADLGYEPDDEPTGAGADDSTDGDEGEPDERSSAVLVGGAGDGDGDERGEADHDDGSGDANGDGDAADRDDEAAFQWVADRDVDEEEADPASLVSSVLDGGDDDSEVEGADGDADAGGDRDGGDPARDGDDNGDGTAEDRTTEHGGTSEDGETAEDHGGPTSGGERTDRRAGRERARRRLQHLNAAGTGGGDGDGGDGSRAGVSRDDDRSTSGGRPKRYALYQRTTATVVGVVVLLVLLSFLATALPLPIGDGPVPDDGADRATPTPEVVTQAGDERTETAVESETATASPTPEPTDSPTPEPTATQTPEPTDSPTPEPTATQTPEPTDSPTPEPTDTPEDDDLLDEDDDLLDVDDDDDGLL